MSGTPTHHYYLKDHLGNNRMVVNQSGTVVQQTDYYPFGYTFNKSGSSDNKYLYNGKELQEDDIGISSLDWLDYGARFYDAQIGRWHVVDPLTHKYPSMSAYMYCGGNPIMFIDPDGREPIKPLVGTSATFRTLLDNSPRKVGSFTGQAAHNYVLSLGNTKFNWKQMRPLPTETGFFNNKKGRYIYTKKGGWIDMTHFMFYAGKAYKYKQDGVENPIGEAVQDGYKQEFSDKYAAPHSAYSYEDLPSDKFGAEFAVDYFDPESDKSFGEQLQNYLDNVLQATDPKNAPNFDDLPKEDTKNPPMRRNKTTTPVYTDDNP